MPCSPPGWGQQVLERHCRVELGRPGGPLSAQPEPHPCKRWVGCWVIENHMHFTEAPGETRADAASVFLCQIRGFCARDKTVPPPPAQNGGGHVRTK